MVLLCMHTQIYKSITICNRHHTLLMYMPWWCTLIHACLPRVATSYKAYHRSGGWYACQHLSLNTFKLLSRTTASTVCSLCMRRNCRETGNKTTHDDVLEAHCQLPLRQHTKSLSSIALAHTHRGHQKSKGEVIKVPSHDVIKAMHNMEQRWPKVAPAHTIHRRQNLRIRLRGWRTCIMY